MAASPMNPVKMMAAIIGSPRLPFGWDPALFTTLKPRFELRPHDFQSVLQLLILYLELLDFGGKVGKLSLQPIQST
jgi:hypothetical protein